MAQQRKTQTQRDYERNVALQAMEQLDTERGYSVVKQNDLIRGTSYSLSRGDSAPLTATQNKILSFLISQIRPDDVSLPVFHFDTQHFGAVCGLNPNAGGSYYIAVNKSLEQLMQKTLKLVSADGNEEIKFHYITACRFNKSKRQCDVAMDPILTKYLCQVTGNFTAYQFKRIAHFSCQYSQPIYELCKSYAYTGRGLVIDVDRLKDYLGCTSYNISNLRKLVLEKAVEEINRFTDIEVRFSFRKEGRRITQICFDIKEPSPEEMQERDRNLEFEFEQYSLFPIGF